MLYSDIPSGPPGPKKAVALLHKVINVTSKPRSARDWLFDLIVQQGWETNASLAQEKAESWSRVALEIIKGRLEHEDPFGRPLLFCLNSSSDYLIQGAAYLDGTESPREKKHKLRRRYIFEIFDAVKSLTYSDFEKLCSSILRLLGCEDAKQTKYAGDEGIDFYGRLSLDKHIFVDDISPTLQKQLNIWMVGQAKHYQKVQVATPDIRELVGSVELARYGAFSKLGVCDDLSIKACDPIFRLFFTTGFISKDGWQLMDRSGVIALDGLTLAAFFCDRKIGLKDEKFDKRLFSNWLKN